MRNGGPPFFFSGHSRQCVVFALVYLTVLNSTQHSSHVFFRLVISVLEEARLGLVCGAHAQLPLRVQKQMCNPHKLSSRDRRYISCVLVNSSNNPRVSLANAPRILPVLSLEHTTEHDDSAYNKTNFDGRQSKSPKDDAHCNRILSELKAGF